MANTTKIDLDGMRELIGAERTNENVPTAKLREDGNVELTGKTLAALRKDVARDIKPQITEVISEVANSEFTSLRTEVDSKIAELMDASTKVRPIEVSIDNRKIKMDGIVHNRFDALLKAVAAQQPVLMVGPAGTGKTHGAEQVSKALGLDFYSISVGSQTSKSDIQGYMTGNGTYVRTQFREAYENGGLFLLDEADAGNSNVLILLNAALSNGYMAFPDGMIARHEDFRMVATANTYGHGASRQYVGRNQLDAATLDRFATIAWDIDDRVETALAGGNTRWLNVVRAVRKRVVEELELRVVVSPRATQRGALLLHAGVPFEEALEMALTGNISASEKPEIVLLAKTVWEKGGQK